MKNMDEFYAYGRNTVREFFRSGNILRLYTRSRFASDALVVEIQRSGVPVSFVDDKELDRLAERGKHQGLVCLAKMPQLTDIKTLVSAGKQVQNPLILILDGIEDPANFGAILRSCDAFGVTGVIIKKTGNATLNATVAKVSTGAVAYVPVAGVSNLSQAISELKDAGYWVVASDGSATMSYEEVDYKCPIALIVGSEGFGISKLVLQRSDFVVKIPMVGHVNSLNASVATGVLLSLIAVQRR